tara:strand:+ start:147 stop:332 length:186 start_codon:yes stop_codon:yes gene_type:complete
MNNESLYFEWLTYSWFIDNVFTLGAIMLLSAAILFLFPVILGYDMNNEITRKEKNNKLKDK